MHVPEMSLRALQKAVESFAGSTGPDAGWVKLQTATAPAVDPARPEHRRALLVWLNAWGCRIRYPRDGEPDLFDAGVGAWWHRWGAALPTPGSSITDLDDAAFAALGDCYADLAAVAVSPPPRRRTVGATAATKMLHALRPMALMPWDEAIARSLHGRRDAAAYADHQRLGREWGRRLLAEAGTDEQTLSSRLGHPGRPLAKMLDDYCYLVYTRGFDPA